MHRYVQERGTRDEAFLADGGPHRSKAKIRSAKVVDRNQGIAPDLFKGLENRQKQMTKHKTRKRSACTIILASSFEFPSSFVIRHWSSATRYSSLFL